MSRQCADCGKHIEGIYYLCAKCDSKPLAPPAPTPCTHPRCFWLAPNREWRATASEHGLSADVRTAYCPDCGSKLPESGPRKVVGLWPEAVDAIRLAKDGLEYLGKHSETYISTPQIETIYGVKIGEIVAGLRAILDAAGEGEQ